MLLINFARNSKRAIEEKSSPAQKPTASDHDCEDMPVATVKSRSTIDGVSTEYIEMLVSTEHQGWVRSEHHGWVNTENQG